jgi:membrane protein required for colicin V production
MIESLALIDWISITLILVFGITGFFNGFIKEIFSTAAWVLSLAIAWLYGPLLFPYVTDFIDSESIKNIVSFVLLFLVSFVGLKILGSIISKLISAIGLKGLDKLLGMFFGSLKVLAILSSVYIFNLNYLDNNQWWIDSYSRIYAIEFYEYSKPVFDKWIDRADIILQKESPKISL